MKFSVNTIKEERDVIQRMKSNLEFLKENRIRFTWFANNKKIEEEYQPNRYENFRKKLIKEWMEYNDNFIEKLSVFLGRKLEEKDFSVKISNYGPLGSYNHKNNSIFINMNIEEKRRIGLIKHEIIHIVLEFLFRKYIVDYKRREKIVEKTTEIINLI